MNKLEIHAGICDGIKDLYQRKNADYGDSFAKARKAVPNYTLGKLYDKFSRTGHGTYRQCRGLSRTAIPAPVSR